ncbi:conserved hypothetical protein [Coccidioides posadasii str. Silveira]|uniref:GPI inositol-deacylase n=1 Tax=Coccidioides posadasii (strain RMSCC 757 / Silveira) TaxID=443226 RepID=E9CTS2_COCPS|nr:conserved hypothetical protein [Coccidioides posadasii str. Silveira]
MARLSCMPIKSFRRKKADTDSSSTDSLHDRVKIKFTTLFSRTKLFGRTAAVVDDGVADPRGPLGLNILHSPSEPLVDFIFVHGLGGGSRETWSNTSSVCHFWPQEWLRKDPAFKNVRVHTFGYDSHATKDSVLHTHHFCRSLLSEMYTSPYLGNTDTPIVLIGHSMGGIVIKKTYLLAIQDPTHRTLAKRIHSIYFLATPHSGCDSARLLNNVLTIAYSSRDYLLDPKVGSAAIDSINDEFRNYADNLHLWSFYETRKTKVGLFSRLIVEPNMAKLGYRGEKQIAMPADHRSICKFDSPKDLCYLILRDSLAETVESISKIVPKLEENPACEQIKFLENYLDLSGAIDDDLLVAQDDRMPGTCEWFFKKQNYLDWSDFASDTPRILWIKGKPGSGKSVLAGYAIDRLLASNESCSYFFFKHEDKSKARLSSCLRSLAFQMARMDVQIRETFSKMQKDGVNIDNENEHSLWKKLFLSGILQAASTTNYWVIDGLDECENVSFLFDSILPQLDKSIPLRILITSRETPELQGHIVGLSRDQFRLEIISPSDIRSDVEFLVGVKTKSPALKDAGDHAALVENIVEKANGSFLWTDLVLKELPICYSGTEINRVLDGLPQEMEALYQRVLGQMALNTRAKNFSQAILTWTTCAMRPLMVKELAGVLKLDINEEFPKLEEAILARCGQLISVDEFSNVRLAHETAKNFLLKDGLDSEFAVSETEAHTRMARICLLYLTGEAIKPRSTGGSRSTSAVHDTDSDFSVYACEAFSYHLVRADSREHDILLLVNKFLESNIIPWVEIMMAHNQNPILLIHTAKNLKKYVNSCATELSPLDGDVKMAKERVTELVHIITKFSDALLTSPSAIYSAILPFYPTECTASKPVGPGRPLSILGLSDVQWVEQLCSMSFPTRGNRLSLPC